MNLASALNILAKWRTHFAGWQLGTRSINDPECQAVRDHREVTILLRAEMNALVKLLMDKRLINAQEWTHAVTEEAQTLNSDYERRFPGVKASETGLHYTAQAAEHMKHWKP